MNSLRLKPALHYQLFNVGKAYLLTFAILTFSHLLFGITNIIWEGNISITFNGMSFIMILMFFILGIVTPYENIKMLLQHGCGRRTIFLSSLLTSLASALVLGLVCELLGGLNFILDDFYSQFYSERFFFNPGWQSFLEACLLRFTAFFAAWQVGSVIGLLYYRLNRTQQVIVSIVLGGLLVFGLPYGLSVWFELAPTVPGFANLVGNLIRSLLDIANNPLGLSALLLLGGVLFTGIGFLLLRRAQVKE